MNDISKLWDYLEESEIATNEELKLVTNEVSIYPKSKLTKFEHI